LPLEARDFGVAEVPVCDKGGWWVVVGGGGWWRKRGFGLKTKVKACASQFQKDLKQGE
jgi:hypothetical protein